MKNIAVLGAGSWGTALSILLAKNGHLVHLWDRDPALIKTLQQQTMNPVYLPDITFPDKIRATASLDAAIQAAEFVLIAIPSSGFCQLLTKIKTYNKPLIWASKGLEPQNNQLLHEVITSICGTKLQAALLSGPSFAKEVAQAAPTAVVVASQDKAYASSVIELFANDYFRPYYSDDVIGVEIGGAVKNVMAIAAGIADGLGFGANARAALITRGLNEITRLAIALGARAETLMGLSGLGDLILTCTDDQSRNRRFGLALGQGFSAKQALNDIGQVVEGADNVSQVIALADKYHLDMPITTHVQQVLQQLITPRQAVKSLFSRDLRPE